MFTTLFGAIQSDFAFISISIRTLFYAMMGTWTYFNGNDHPEQKNFQLSFTLLMMIHIFISSIFLLNYLIAILSMVFNIMKDYGEFKYKSNKY